MSGMMGSQVSMLVGGPLSSVKLSCASISESSVSSSFWPVFVTKRVSDMTGAALPLRGRTDGAGDETAEEDVEEETTMAESDGEGGARRDRLAGRGEVMDPLLDRPPLGEGDEKLE